jgi:hypothetical protein
MTTANSINEMDLAEARATLHKIADALLIGSDSRQGFIILANVEKFTPEQKERLEQAKEALRAFVKTYGPYATLALPLIAVETLPEAIGK